MRERVALKRQRKISVFDPATSGGGGGGAFEQPDHQNQEKVCDCVYIDHRRSSDFALNAAKNSPKRMRSTTATAAAADTQTKTRRSISVGIRPFGLTKTREEVLVTHFPTTQTVGDGSGSLIENFDGVDEKFNEFLEYSCSPLQVAVGRKTSTTFQRRQRRSSEVGLYFLKVNLQ